MPDEDSRGRQRSCKWMFPEHDHPVVKVCLDLVQADNESIRHACDKLTVTLISVSQLPQRFSCVPVLTYFVKIRFFRYETTRRQSKLFSKQLRWFAMCVNQNGANHTTNGPARTNGRTLSSSTGSQRSLNNNLQPYFFERIPPYKYHQMSRSDSLAHFCSCPTASDHESKKSFTLSLPSTSLADLYMKVEVHSDAGDGRSLLIATAWVDLTKLLSASKRSPDTPSFSSRILRMLSFSSTNHNSSVSCDEQDSTYNIELQPIPLKLMARARVDFGITTTTDDESGATSYAFTLGLKSIDKLKLGLTNRSSRQLTQSVLLMRITVVDNSSGTVERSTPWFQCLQKTIMPNATDATFDWVHSLTSFPHDSLRDGTVSSYLADHTICYELSHLMRTPATFVSKRQMAYNNLPIRQRRLSCNTGLDLAMNSPSAVPSHAVRSTSCSDEFASKNATLSGGGDARRVSLRSSLGRQDSNSNSTNIFTQSKRRTLPTESQYESPPLTTYRASIFDPYKMTHTTESSEVSSLDAAVLKTVAVGAINRFLCQKYAALIEELRGDRGSADLEELAKNVVVKMR